MKEQLKLFSESMQQNKFSLTLADDLFVNGLKGKLTSDENLLFTKINKMNPSPTIEVLFPSIRTEETYAQFEHFFSFMKSCKCIFEFLENPDSYRKEVNKDFQSNIIKRKLNRILSSPCITEVQFRAIPKKKVDYFARLIAGSVLNPTSRKYILHDVTLEFLRCLLRKNYQCKFEIFLDEKMTVNMKLINVYGFLPIEIMLRLEFFNKWNDHDPISISTSSLRAYLSNLERVYINQFKFLPLYNDYIPENIFWSNAYTKCLESGDFDTSTYLKRYPWILRNKKF